ncbi:ATP-binding protein [Amycolatopsis sp. CA-128772]|uniref:ATP-binding protein n=1 Tax=Amycolatopsis sp. CA-128772 TaxID=2073159 RepID=UPI001E5F4B8D|nr:ATP-binding protein [Amycolatopsis sp. CA-128772]
MSGADVSRLTVARQWAADHLDTLGERVKFDAVLVVGELLENAFLHGGGPHQLRIHHHVNSHEVIVAVADRGIGEPLQRVPDRRGGRGLLLVDAVGAEWGVRRHDDGKLIWGRLDCDTAEL